MWERYSIAMSKTFLELFNRYSPTDLHARILSSGKNLGVKVNKENRCAEVHMFFPEIIKKEELYKIEDNVKSAYDLNMFVIKPSYPKELFRRDYIPEVIAETERSGIVSRGFFEKCTYRLEKDRLSIKIGFSDGGVNLLYDARTPEVISGIIRDEFGLNITVCIEHDENYGEEYKNFQNKCRNTLKTLYTESEAAAAELIAKNAAADAVDERSLLPKFCSIDGPELEKDTMTSDEKIIYFSDDVFKIGNMTFDVSEPSVILGDTFAINPTPLRI